MSDHTVKLQRVDRSVRSFMMFPFTSVHFFFLVQKIIEKSEVDIILST